MLLSVDLKPRNVQIGELLFGQLAEEIVGIREVIECLLDLHPLSFAAVEGKYGILPVKRRREAQLVSTLLGGAVDPFSQVDLVALVVERSSTPAVHLVQLLQERLPSVIESPDNLREFGVQQLASLLLTEFLVQFLDLLAVKVVDFNFNLCHSISL